MFKLAVQNKTLVAALNSFIILQQPNLAIFDYVYIIWGDKTNKVLMNSLQISQNKAAKTTLDKPLFSSASVSLKELNWKTVEKRRFYHRFYIFKCKHGYIGHHLSLIEKKEIHDYNTRNKCNVRLPLSEN